VAESSDPGPARSGPLIIEPGAGFSPVYGLINGARHSIDHISYYSSSTGFYIHGKVIEADYGTGHAKIFIGSENFSGTSLNDNRELGLIISDPAVLSAVARTFAA